MKSALGRPAAISSRNRLLSQGGTVIGILDGDKGIAAVKICQDILHGGVGMNRVIDYELLFGSGVRDDIAIRMRIIVLQDVRPQARRPQQCHQAEKDS